MSLYEKLKQLQVLEDADEAWKDYRKEVTAYLCGQLYGAEEIAVLGAGRCSDIDLGILSACFRKIVLLDKDQAALKAAALKYKLQEKQVSFEVVDFIDLEESDYELYGEMLIQEVRKKGMQTDVKALADVAVKLLSDIEKKINTAFLNSQQKTYENLIVIGVHSQLLSMLEWMWSIMLQTIEKDEESVRAFIIQMNERIIRRFNKQLIENAKHKLVIGCEAQRIGTAGTVQGAVQCIKDIEERITSQQIKCLSTQEMIWPFNLKEQKAYLMKFYTLETDK